MSLQHFPTGRDCYQAGKTIGPKGIMCIALGSLSRMFRRSCSLYFI